MGKIMFEKFSERAGKIKVLAIEIAREMGIIMLELSMFCLG